MLFIKMGLHPLTLEDFIWGHEETGLKHCFHTQISVRILLSIVDGLEYIHDNRIIHRDIKPSNIFLSISKDQQSKSERNINITGCHECGLVTNTRLTITPHIGDFGLAAELKNNELAPSGEENAIVSHPPSASGFARSMHLDIPRPLTLFPNNSPWP